MYEMAKKAREAMKSKARRLASEKSGKVDSSDWSPAEPLNADVKTGMRPLSRRAFKKGGKVEGACAPVNLGRKARKSGGKVSAKEITEEKSEATKYAKAKTNRDVKAANEERPGLKHIGGMKKGGRAAKADGGMSKEQLMEAYKKGKERADAMPAGEAQREATKQVEARQNAKRLEEMGRKSGGRAKKMDGGTLDKMVDPAMRGRIEAGSKTPTEMPKNPPMPPRRPAEPVGGKGTAPVGLDKDQVERLERGRKDGGKIPTTLAGQKKVQKEQAAASEPHRGKAQHYKKGGRAEKMDGGGADPRLNIVKKNAMEFSGAQGSPYKKGGKVDLSKIIRNKKTGELSEKPVGYAKKMGGGALAAGLMGGLLPAMSMGIMGKDKEKDGEGKKKGGRVGKFYGGAMGMPQLPPQAAQAAQQALGNMGGGMGGLPPMAGAAPLPQGMGMPMPRKSGGRAKGKTNINIVIAAGKPATPDMMQGQGGPPMPPPGVPVPLPGGPGGAPGGMPMGGPMGGMPMPPPMPMPPSMPGGPMARKDGGRITKVAKSYKDMEAGSGGAEGRLQKTDIAKTGKSAPAYKAGGKVYRSYKDMDAGSGSGLGRMEKTEIQSRKR